MKQIALLMLFTSMMVLVGCKPAAPAQMPAWELKDMDGKSVKSTDFAGKVLIIDFWATWCPPCVKEIPGFVKLQEAYRKQGLEVVGISLDQEGASVVKPFMSQHKVNYTVLQGNEQVTQQFGGVEGIPTTFVVDKTGKIISKHVGYVEESVFEKEIKPLLK